MNNPPEKIRAAIDFARQEFRNNGAEGETVWLLCEVVEQLQHELLAVQVEIARITHCHICGDCLWVEDGRCELHASTETGEGDDPDDCACAYCTQDGKGGQG